MPAPADMSYWLGQKYAILGKQAEGEFQRNIAEAYKTRQEGGQVVPNAASLRELQKAQGFNLRAEGQLRTEQAGTEARTNRFFDNPDAIDFMHDWLTNRQALPTRGVGAIAPPPALTPGEAQGGSATPAVAQPPWHQLPTPDEQDRQQAAALPAESAAAPAPVESATPAVPSIQLQSADELTQGAKAATAKSLLPPLGGTSPDLRRPLTAARPSLFNDLDSGPNPSGYRRGTANVKAPPGKGGKAGGAPKGLEAILPMLMAAMQGGGGAAPGGPPAGPPAGPPPAPGGAGLRKGSANVKAPPGKAGKASKAGGLEAILPTLLAASQASQAGGGAVGPQAADALPPAMAPSAAAPPGYARGATGVRPLLDSNAHSAPGYPFGAGYLFGKTAVPGQGSGTVDKVPAVLAPHEAVLNRAAADIMGRGKIAALNAAGVRQMGLNRGVR